MKKYLTGLLCAILFTCSAQAEQVSYQFQGYISELIIYDWSQPLPQFPSSITLPEDTVWYGDAIRGTFSYDRTTPLQANQDNWEPTYSGPAPSLQVAMKFDYRNISYKSTTSDSTIAIWDNDPAMQDAFSFNQANGPWDSGRSVALELSFGNETAVNGNAIPANLSTFDRGLFTLSVGDNAGPSQRGYTIMATVTSIDRISPVPEPETYVMLLAGLGLMAGLSRSRRSRT